MVMHRDTKNAPNPNTHLGCFMLKYKKLVNHEKTNNHPEGKHHLRDCYHHRDNNPAIYLQSPIKPTSMEEVITRTMFCKRCHGLGRPLKGNMFIVYGHTGQTISIRKCHQDGFTGFTPHFIVYQVPLVITEKGIRMVHVCCIDSCGVSIGKDNGDGVCEITFLEIVEMYLSPSDFSSLLTNWRGTGYEII